MRPRVLFASIALTSFALPATAQAPLFAKDVAAPPSDIESGLVRLPEASELIETSRTALIPVTFEADTDGRMRFRFDLPLQEVGPLSLVAIGADAPRWETSLRLPGLPAAPLRELARVGFAGRWTGEGSDLLPGTIMDRFDLPVVPAKRIQVEIVAPADVAAPGGHLLIAAAGTTRLSSRVSTLQTLADEPVAITAELSGEAIVDRAELHARVGAFEVVEPMFDDGLHGDGAAGDGTYGAWLPYGIAGSVRARAEIEGRDANGGGFLLNAHHAFELLEREVALTGEVTAVVRDQRRLGLEVGLLREANAGKLLVAAEVWGTDANGTSVPVAWLAKMIAPGAPAELMLDGRWLNRAGVAEDVHLRHVRVQDPDTNVPFDMHARLDVLVTALPDVVGAAPVEITADMRMGVAPFGAPGASEIGAGFAAEVRGRIEYGSLPALMLSHGYCSGGSIWPAAQFSQPKFEFLDPNQNRTHDQFALLMREQASGFTSFGIVAHSQGGIAGTHLYNFYWSGLDLADGPRRIQALASPFAGTPLASLGDLGPCGANADLTPRGSTTWLAGITSATRGEVTYWTTANAGFFSCVPLVGLILSSPNDGTVENFRGQLSGATNAGFQTGWCHTTGMQEPASYTDSTRNAEMNAQAAR